MGVLLPKIKPLIYSNGGPVITVQVRINNWIHYDLKVTYLPAYLPKATYYYITLRSRRVRSDVDARKNGTAEGHTPKTRAWKQYVSVACPVLSRTHISFKRLLRRVLWVNIYFFLG